MTTPLWVLSLFVVLGSLLVCLLLGGILASAAKRCPKCDRHTEGEKCQCEKEQHEKYN